MSSGSDAARNDDGNDRLYVSRAGLRTAIDARSDVFSFGVVLYEMLAAGRPFTGGSGSRGLAEDHSCAPQRLGADVPASLEALVEKALEKEPADRYQSMRELVVDLRRTARKDPESGRPEVSSAGRQRSGAKAVALRAALWPWAEWAAGF